MEFKISLTRSPKPQQQKIVLTPVGKHDCFKPEMVNERFGVSTEFMDKLEKTYNDTVKKGMCGHEATLAMAALCSTPNELFMAGWMECFKAIKKKSSSPLMDLVEAIKNRGGKPQVEVVDFNDFFRR